MKCIFLVVLLLSSSLSYASADCEVLFEPVVPAALEAQVGDRYSLAVIGLLQAIGIREEEIQSKLNFAIRARDVEGIQQARALVNLGREFNERIDPILRAMRENAVLPRQSTELRELVDEDQMLLSAELDLLLRSMKGQLTSFLHPIGEVAMLEIGPSPSGAFSGADLGRLLRMYLRYSGIRGWNAEIVEESNVDGVLRHVTLKISGPESYRLLSFERGDHRFIDEGVLRFTRYASVQVYRPPSEREFRVNLDDFNVTATRSSGPGGQHVNTTDSAVIAVHRPTGLSAKIGLRRSQQANRQTAIELLTARLFRNFQRNQSTLVREARSEGRKNQYVEAQSSRWTRTYDWSTNSVQAERTLNGDLDPFLMPFQENALIVEMDKLRARIETGTSL